MTGRSEITSAATPRRESARDRIARAGRRDVYVLPRHRLGEGEGVLDGPASLEVARTKRTLTQSSRRRRGCPPGPRSDRSERADQPKRDRELHAEEEGADDRDQKRCLERRDQPHSLPVPARSLSRRCRDRTIQEPPRKARNAASANGPVSARISK